MEREPFIIELGNTEQMIEYGKVVVRAYQRPDDVFNHLEINEYDTQIKRIFNVGAQCVMLAGVVLPGFEGKDGRKLAEAIRPQIGWNVPTTIDEEAPEEIKEKYINLTMGKVVAVPEEWNNGA